MNTTVEDVGSTLAVSSCEDMNTNSNDSCFHSVNDYSVNISNGSTRDIIPLTTSVSPITDIDRFQHQVSPISIPHKSSQETASVVTPDGASCATSQQILTAAAVQLLQNTSLLSSAVSTNSQGQGPDFMSLLSNVNYPHTEFPSQISASAVNDSFHHHHHHEGSVCTMHNRGKTTSLRLNKFVRRLHDMLISEQDNGIVEWRSGLLVLHSTVDFAKIILPKYFNTKNFKTFRRQLNYYGFVHVRSFSATGNTTTALWVNQELAKEGGKSISSVLRLKRVDPCPDAKTAEGRRVRKEEAFHVVEDIGINTEWVQLAQIKSLGRTRGLSLDKGSPPHMPSQLYPHNETIDSNIPNNYVHSEPCCRSEIDNPEQVSGVYNTEIDANAANMLISLLHSTVSSI